VSRYQKGKSKTNLDFTEARDSEWQWHQLGHMHVSTSLQTDNHVSTPPLSFLLAGCPSCRPTNSVIALKANQSLYTLLVKYNNNNRRFTAIIQVSLRWPTPPVMNWLILLVQSFTAHMLLLTAAGAFGLGGRRWSSPQQCRLHCLRSP